MVNISVLIAVATLVLVPVPAFEQEERIRMSIKTMDSIEVLILSIILTSAITHIYTSVDRAWPTVVKGIVHHLPLAVREDYHTVLTG